MLRKTLVDQSGILNVLRPSGYKPCRCVKNQTALCGDWCGLFYEPRSGSIQTCSGTITPQVYTDEREATIMSEHLLGPTDAPYLTVGMPVRVCLPMSNTWREMVIYRDEEGPFVATTDEYIRPERWGTDDKSLRVAQV